MYLFLKEILCGAIDIDHDELSGDCAEFIADVSLFFRRGKTPRMLSNICVDCVEKNQ